MSSPVEEPEDQGLASWASCPWGNPGDTTYVLGGLRALSEGQGTGDLRHTDSHTTHGSCVSLRGMVCESPEVLECQAIVPPKVLDQRLEGQVQDPPDLKGGTSVTSVLTGSSSSGTAPVGRMQDTGRGSRGWESPPLAPVQPEGLNPGLGEWRSKGTSQRRRRNPRRRGRGRRASPLTPGPPRGVDPRLGNQWQSSPVLQTGRVENGYYVPGVTTPHSVNVQRPMASGWPRAWSWSRTARDYQWGSPAGPEWYYRGNNIDLEWRKTGGCPCRCGPASLFYRPKQGSPSRW